MSAFLCSAKHLSVLAAQSQKPLETFKMLLRANLASLAARYGEGTDEALAASYVYKAPSEVVRPGRLADLIHCYDYQSCEYSGWKESEARRYCLELCFALVTELPGYNKSGWGI